MPTYQIFNTITGETVRTETVADDKQRPVVPNGCALRLAPEQPDAAEPTPATSPGPEQASVPATDIEAHQEGA